MKNVKKTFTQIFSILTALAAIGVAIFVIYRNWAQITDFCTQHCKCLKSKALRKEYSDYID